MVFGQTRGPGDDARRAQRRAAELDGALGEIIGVLEDLVHDLVEELMERDEVRALDVPVRLLGLEREVQGVAELLVQELDGAAADLLGQVILRVPHRFFTHGLSPVGWIDHRRVKPAASRTPTVFARAPATSAGPSRSPK